MKRLERDKLHPSNTDKHLYYFFECKCGQIVSKRGDNKTEFCNQPGCNFSKRIKHGKSDSDLYCVWEGIKQRTLNPNANGAHTYHGKGITICEEWKSFIPFEQWAIANGYKKGLTIDRKDILGHYEPSNCQWISRTDNTLLQHKDGHGTSVPVSCTYRNGLWDSFPNKTECAKFMKVFGGKLADRTDKTIIDAIDKSIKRNKDYYGWTFKYE